MSSRSRRSLVLKFWYVGRNAAIPSSLERAFGCHVLIHHGAIKCAGHLMRVTLELTEKKYKRGSGWLYGIVSTCCANLWLNHNALKLIETASSYPTQTVSAGGQLM